MDPTAISERLNGALAALLGLRVLEASPDRVTAQLAMWDDFAAWAVPSTGTLMDLAATVGAAATRLTLSPGAGTTALESTTNFLAVGRAGRGRAEAPLANPRSHPRRQPLSGLRETARWHQVALTRRVTGSRRERRKGKSIVKRNVTGDLWADAKLLQAEERVAEARAFTARRALLRDSRPPRRGVRVWLGSFLLAVGHRLLGSVPSSAGPA
jgi:acyl-coenzyme A thioesterase PaaI-like protein